MGIKLRVGINETRQIRQYEPKKYDISYEIDLGPTIDPSDLKPIADGLKNRLQAIINEWFEEDFKKNK